MTPFILISAIVTLLVLIVLVRPLLRQGDADENDRQMHNIHYARHRLAELKQQKDNGKLDPSDFDQLRRELESTLAQDIDIDGEAGANGDRTPSSSNSSPILIATLCALLPIAALLTYWLVGTPQMLNASNIKAAQTIPSSNANLSDTDIQAMVAKLRQRLQENPDDAEGWAILARTLLATGQYRESIKANQKLLVLSGEHPDTYASMADASAILASGTLLGKPLEYVERALELDPSHPQSLWLAGLGAAQQGDSATARGYWNSLLPLLADVPQQQQELAEIIQQTLNEPSSSLSTTKIEQAPQEQVSGLTVLIEIADEIKANTQPNDIVFVFAKAKQGPPAPLAVKRLRVKDLPARVTLSDADAMLAQFSLSKFEEVLISARVSKSGQPTAQKGDLQSLPIQTRNSNSKLIIAVITEIVE